MAIRDLGESLLARQKASNKARYKKSRNEAYKIAAMQFGAGLLNEATKNSAIEFMNSEPMLAQKAKLRAAANRSQDILNTNQAILESGKDVEQYLLDTKYLPQMEAEYKAAFGEEFVPQSYLPIFRDKARDLAREEASAFNEALNYAQSIPDYETAVNEMTAIAMPPTNAGAAILQKVKGLFSGKTSEDFRQEAVQRVQESGLLKNESYKRAFDKLARTDGIDEAINFVKTLDTRGFTKNHIMDVKVDVQPLDNGRVMLITNTFSTDPVSNRKTVNTSTQTIEGYEGEENQAKITRGIIEKADMPAMVKDFLTPKGTAYLTRELSERGLNLYNINSLEELDVIGNLLLDVQHNPSFIKDTANQQAMSTILSAIISSTDLYSQSVVGEAERDNLPLEQVQTRMLQNLIDVYDSVLGSSTLSEEEEPSWSRTPSPNQEVDFFNLRRD